MRGLGTIVNVITVLAGTGVGVLLHGRMPERVRSTVLDGIGLIVLGVGIASFLETRNAVFPVVAIVAGGVLGELIRIEDRLEALGERLRRLVEAAASEPAIASYVERDPDELQIDREPGESRSFVDGFLLASLTFGIGAMMIVGSLQDGISGDSELLIVKATLDGLVSVPFAAVYGWGVGFSALSIAVLQGAITLLGATVGDSLLDDRMVAEIEATGGVMILGIGLRLLDLKKVKVGSFLPALAIAPVLVAVFAS
ncbi:DUF554 domain-containing protein [Acidimicrobiia bacterium EGI L10123]|uniref:DUF554 domain-containing protein n=1 Tax=Salinilacustrithrix flava TaxID=2957203 RepID=UPI003D7C3573|nr:DUF554 domain-containing protein [Acidimicrobiia bacterium EGI L10123]